jgi:hypothetical protein
MYFWKIDKLKADLRERQLTESETFKYLIATQVLYGLAMIPYITYNIWDVYSAIVTLFVTLVGVYYVYKCNNGTTGSNFLQRYLALSWVVGIRSAILFIIPAAVVFYAVFEIYSDVPDYTTPFDVLFGNALFAVFYVLLGKHIKELSRS